MASHDGKRRSHQRFLRNLPKQKPGKYLKGILSSVADPEEGRGGGGGFLSLGLPAFLPSAIPFFFFFNFFFLPKIRKGGVDWVPPGLFPRSATALARAGLIAAYLLFWAGLFEKGLTLILV